MQMKENTQSRWVSNLGVVTDDITGCTYCLLAPLCTPRPHGCSTREGRTHVTRRRSERLRINVNASRDTWGRLVHQIPLIVTHEVGSLNINFKILTGTFFLTERNLSVSVTLYGCVDVFLPSWWRHVSSTSCSEVELYNIYSSQTAFLKETHVFH